MKRNVKIIGQNFFGIRRWTVTVFIDGKYITEYSRETRAKARELSRKFIETGLLPAN